MHCAPSTAHNITHPRWRRFFLLGQKEKTRAAFAEFKLLFAMIMPQIGRQLPGLLWKNKKTTEPKSTVVFHFAAVELWNLILKSFGWHFKLWRLWSLLYSYTDLFALTSQYLAWDRYCTSVVQTPRMERQLFLQKNDPRRSTRGRAIFDVNTKFSAEFTFCCV